MAYKTVANLRDSISGILSGLNLNNVTNLNTVLERSARELTQLINIDETEANTQITLYDGVTDYLAPTDAYGGSIIDLRPQGTSRQISDYPYQMGQSDFDRTKGWHGSGHTVAWEFVKGVGRLRIDTPYPQPKIEIDPMTDTTGWTAGGSASGLAQDETVFWTDPASLRFTLTGSSTGQLTKTVPSFDMTDYVGVGVIFLAIRTPSASNLSSITIAIGSDSSNYYIKAVNTGFLGSWVSDEWLLVAFDLATATKVGNPVVTATDYCNIFFSHSGTITNMRVGGLWMSLPYPATLIYSTDALFQASGSNPSQSISGTGDSIILTDDAYIIYEHLCALNIAHQQGGTLASGVVGELKTKLFGGGEYKIGLIDYYTARNPIQNVPTIFNYYDA